MLQFKIFIARYLRINLLTRQERFEIYCEMFLNLHRFSALGFCYALYMVVKADLVSEYMSVILPELNKYRPKDKFDNSYWFPKEDDEKRITILTDIIRAMDKQDPKLYRTCPELYYEIRKLGYFFF